MLKVYSCINKIKNFLDKLKRFLSSHNTSSLKKSIEDNIENSKRDLYNEIPTSFDNELSKINKKIKSQFV